MQRLFLKQIFDHIETPSYLYHIYFYRKPNLTNKIYSNATIQGSTETAWDSEIRLNELADKVNYNEEQNFDNLKMRWKSSKLSASKD